MAICIECDWVNEPNLECNNSDLPVTDFVLGTRSCDELNSEGDCKGFKAKPPPYIPYPEPYLPYQPYTTGGTVNTESDKLTGNERPFPV